jgi:endoglucanase
MTSRSPSAAIYLSALLAGACVDGAPVESRSAALTTSGLFYQGVNLTGAERGFGAAIEESWGPAIPGVDGSTYVWPNPDLNTNVAALDSALFPGGVNTVRLPFQWERLQPVLSGPFDSGYLAKLKATAEALRKRGATVLLDVHNYAYYKRNNRGTSQPGQHIGSADVPIDGFVDLWRRLAQEFGSSSKSHPYVFGLMNEPHDIAVSVWVDAARQALTAIRGTGAKNLILLPGADWTTANDFSWSQNRNLLQTVVDPDDNMAIDVHQYYDDACVANGYVDKLRPFEEWAVANRRVAWLSEMDLPEASDACRQAFVNLLTHLHAKAAGTNGGVWSGYAYWVIDASSTTSGASFVSTPLPLLRPHLPGTCGSRARDGQETDVDCGGTCRRCADGRGCTKDTDCQSGFCSGNVCAGAGGIGGAAGGGGGRGGAGGMGGNGSAGTSGSAGTTGMAGAIAGGGGRGGVMGTGGSAGTTGSAGTIGAAGASGTTGGGGSTGAGGDTGTAGASAGVAGTNTSGGRGGSPGGAGAGAGGAGADNPAGCACGVAPRNSPPMAIVSWLLGAVLVWTRSGQRSVRRGDSKCST